MTRERLGHVPALDGVRGLAIAAVVGFHFFDTPSGGAIGVDLFFVLSGFLITTLLLEEQSTTGRISLVEFYKRRGRRLLPGLGALLAAAAAVLLTGGSSVVSPRSLIGGAFYVTNIIDAFHPIHGALQHLWTLAEEEQFYLLWPIVLLWLLRRRVSPMRLARGLAVAVFALIVYRAGLTAGGVWLSRISKSPDTHADPLLVGCLLAALRAGGVVFRSRWIGVLGLVAFASLSFVLYHPGVGYVSPWWDHTAVSIPVVELAAAALVAGAIAPAGTAAVRLLSVAPLVWLGQISYSLYLWHPIVSTYAPNKIVVVPVALLFAWGSYKLIEQPFRKHRSSLSRAAETPAVGVDAAAA